MFFETITLGGRPKSKEFLKNLDSTWSGNFFDDKSMKLQWGKTGVLVQNDQIRLKNGQKWTKMVKNGEIRLNVALRKGLRS